MDGPQDFQAQADAAIRDCARHIDTVGAQPFMNLLKIRLQMHQENLVEVPGDYFCVLQGRARELKDMLRKLERLKKT